MSSHTRLITQITFSRDWLAGSGKRSPKVTFSRDWLAGSGKRSMAEDNDMMMQQANTEIAATRQLVEFLVQYLTSDEARRMSFSHFLQQHQKA